MKKKTKDHSSYPYEMRTRSPASKPNHYPPSSYGRRATTYPRKPQPYLPNPHRNRISSSSSNNNKPYKFSSTNNNYHTSKTSYGNKNPFRHKKSSYKTKEPRNVKKVVLFSAILLTSTILGISGGFLLLNKQNNNTVNMVDASTLDNKVMAGYQGWFMASGDGAGVGWRHWASSTPNPSSISFDMWPDLREYDSDELFINDFKYSNGQNAGLYSAYNPKTVDLHVKWMKDYGIDGVFVQRFISEAVDITNVRDRVLDNIRIASEKYGRVFVNMYDGWHHNGGIANIKNDWMHLVDDEKITESDRYLHHKGRPVLAIWGIGFDHRPGTPSEATELITWLTQTAPEKYQVTLMGGIDDKWRDHSSDWINVYHSLDIISPWAVGRYSSDSGADNFRNNRIEPDLVDCNNHNIAYLPVIFPGFSWHNLKGAELNQIPRRGGRFYWRQAYNAIDAGCNMIYVAMFDEVDESTAMFKITENPDQTPTTGTFLTLDADGESLPSDWYLRLMGESSKMLRKEITLTSTITITP